MTRAELIQFINANIYPNGRNQITAPMVRDSILAVVGFLGDAAVKDIGAVLENNTDLVTGGAVYDAIRAYLSSVMKMVGETTTDVITNPTANPVYVDGEPHSAQKGDVVVYGYKEFWWTGSQWKELGDEASWALKTITITGTGDITGGGSLEANRTLDLTQNAKDKLAHGETAFSWLESYSTNRLRLKSPYAYLNARKGLILEEETDYTNTPADFVKQVITIGETEYTILRSKLPIVSDSFISAGGVSPGGGASGTTLDAVWGSLTTNTDDFANDKIHSGHIPLGSGLGVDGSGNIYVTSQGTVTGIKIGSTTYTPSAGSTIVDISSGIPTSMAWSAITSTPTTLAGYGITDAKIESGVITLGSNTITPLTSHQTLYNLVINNSAGTAQITYQPGVSGTYALTLTKAMVGLSNVENTALSTWAGTSNITTLGTISTGVWQGTAIGYNYVAAHYIGRTRTTASAAQATLLGIDAISNASSSGSSDTSRIVWDSTNNAWHFLGGIYADSFISAGGLSSGGGTSGIDLAAMWASLQNTDIVDTYDTYQFAAAHLPTCGSGLSYTISNGIATGINVSFPVTSVAGYTGAITAQQIAQALNLGSFAYKNSLSVSDIPDLSGTYLPLAGGTMSGVITMPYNYQIQWVDGDAMIYGTSSNMYLFTPGAFFVNRNLVYHAGNFIAGTDYQTPIPANTYAPYYSAGYVKKDGDTMTGALTMSNARIVMGTNAISMGSGLLGAIYTSYPYRLVWHNGTDWQTVLHAANYDGYAVSLTTDQTISGIKTISGGLVFPTDSNCSDVYRNIPFGNGTYTNRIMYVDNTLTFNPSTGKLKTNGYVVNGGTSSDFLKGDGSLDSTAYLPLTAGSSYPLTGHLYMTHGCSIVWANQGYIDTDANHNLLFSDTSTWRTVYHSGNSNKNDISWTCNALSAVSGVFANGNYGGQLTIKRSGVAYDSVIRYENSNGFLGYIGMFSGGYPYWTNDSSGSNIYALYSEYNANKSNVAWACSTLTASGQVTAPGCLIGLIEIPANQNIINAKDNYTLFINYTRSNNVVMCEGGGNVGIGGAPGSGIRLDVAGVIHATTGIFSDGYVTAGAASSSSDARLKDNIKTFDYSTELLMAIKPREWDWNKDSHLEGHAAGFVAQEMLPVLPYAVGSINDEKFGSHYTLNYDMLHALEVSGLQSHETRIQQLENRVRELESENNQLR